MNSDPFLFDNNQQTNRVIVSLTVPMTCMLVVSTVATSICLKAACRCS